MSDDFLLGEDKIIKKNYNYVEKFTLKFKRELFNITAYYVKS